MNDQTVLIFLADGFEEVEALAVVDVLRRGNVDIKMVALNENKHATSAHGVEVVCDLAIQEVPRDAAPRGIILPGGMPGAENLHASAPLMELLRKQRSEDRLLAAICASPGLVLGKEGLLDGLTATTYPTFEKYFTDAVKHDPQPVVKDGNVITGQGPAFAYHFAFEILNALEGTAITRQVQEGMLVPSM